MLVVRAKLAFKYSAKSSNKQGINRIKFNMNPGNPSIFGMCFFIERYNRIIGITASIVYPIFWAYSLLYIPDLIRR